MRKVHVALISLLIILLSPSYTLWGVYANVEDNVLLYQLFLEWLQGKPVGLVKIVIRPSTPDDYIVIVHNLTAPWAKPYCEIIYKGKSLTPLIKILRYVYSTRNGRIEYFPVDFLVVLIGRSYFGAATVHVVPRKPFVTAEVEVNVHEKANRVESILQSSSGSTVLGYAGDWVKSGALHTIVGMTATWYITRNTRLYYSQFVREGVLSAEHDPSDPSAPVEYSGDWFESGKASADSVIGTGRSLSNGDKRLIELYVEYRWERHWLLMGSQYEIWEILVPVWIKNIKWGNSIKCTLCGKTAPNPNLYIDPEDKLPYELDLYYNDDARWLETAVTLIFSITGGPFEFSLEVAIYRTLTGESPYLTVDSIDWSHGNKLYYWWTDGNSIVHFSWKSES